MRENNDFGANSFMVNSTSHNFDGLLQPTSSVNNGIIANGIASTPKIPKSPWLPFSLLIATISDKVSSGDMSHINEHYELYKKQNISRDGFVKELRLIVGDTLLRAAITNLHFQIPSNGGLEHSNQNEG